MNGTMRRPSGEKIRIVDFGTSHRSVISTLPDAVANSRMVFVTDCRIRRTSSAARFSFANRNIPSRRTDRPDCFAIPELSRQVPRCSRGHGPNRFRPIAPGQKKSQKNFARARNETRLFESCKGRIKRFGLNQNV